MTGQMEVSKYQLSSAVKFIVEDLNSKINDHGVKSNEILDSFLAISLWFQDLTGEDLERLHDELSILDRSVLMKLEIGEKTSKEFEDIVENLSTVEEDYKASILDLIMRSLVLVKEKKFSINFDSLYELLSMGKARLANKF